MKLARVCIPTAIWKASGPTGIEASLRPSVDIDTNIFIYQVEIDAKYGSLTHHIFDWLERVGNSGVTSTITIAELLVAPYGNRDQQQVDLFYSIMATDPNLPWIPPTLAVSDEAAQICPELDSKCPLRFRRP